MFPIPIKIVLIISDIALIIILSYMRRRTGIIHDLVWIFLVIVSIVCIVDGFIGLVIL